MNTTPEGDNPRATVARLAEKAALAAIVLLDELKAVQAAALAPHDDADLLSSFSGLQGALLAVHAMGLTFPKRLRGTSKAARLAAMSLRCSSCGIRALPGVRTCPSCGGDR